MATGLIQFLQKYNADSLVCPITHMVNSSVIPVILSAWNMAVVTPIYKSGDKTDLSNYRPISILPIISKEAEKMGS